MKFSAIYSLVIDVIDEAPDREAGDGLLIDKIVMVDPAKSELIRPELAKPYERAGELKQAILKLRDEERDNAKEKKEKAAIPHKSGKAV